MFFAKLKFCLNWDNSNNNRLKIFEKIFCNRNRTPKKSLSVLKNCNILKFKLLVRRQYLFCSVLFCSVLFCSVLFCSVLFCSSHVLNILNPNSFFSVAIHFLIYGQIITFFKNMSTLKTKKIKKNSLKAGSSPKNFINL